MDALPDFRVLNPTTLDEVVAARAAHPDSKPLGGGTDLVVNIRRGIVAPPVLIDMNRVPTIQDSPPIEVGIVESNDPHGPFGAKEAGEGSLAAFLPALTNAIADAIGIRFNDLPVTPDRVFEAIEKRKRKGNGGAA